MAGSSIYEVKVVAPGISLATTGQKVGQGAKLIQTANHALLQRAAWRQIELLSAQIQQRRGTNWGVLVRVDWSVYEPIVGPPTRSLLGVYIAGAGATFCEALGNQDNVLRAGSPPDHRLVVNWVWMTPLGAELWIPGSCRKDGF